MRKLYNLSYLDGRDNQIMWMDDQELEITKRYFNDIKQMVLIREVK